MDQDRYYPVAELSAQPLRPSGPEPLDPGRMPAWGRQSYRADLFDQPVGADEPNHPYDGEEYVERDGLQYKKDGMWDRLMAPDPEPESRLFGLSKNEQRLALVGGVALVGYLLLRKKGPKKNPARRRRRRRR